MALFSPSAGTATVAANAQSIAISGCDITPLTAGMAIHLGSRARRAGDGYIINTVLPNGTNGGTVTTLDAVPTAYANAAFVVDMGAGLSSTPTGYATFVLSRILTYLTGFLGVGTNLDGASKDIALDRGNAGAGTFSRIKASIAGRLWFGREQRTVGGVETWTDRVYPDGTNPVDALVIRGDTGGVDYLVSGTIVAAAGTTDLGALNTKKVEITGNTSITSFGPGPHRHKLLRFAGVLTLTHNATSLILPGAANITTAIGDTAIATSDSSGNWTVRHYQRADGSPVVGPKSATVTLLTNAAATGPATAWPGGTGVWSIGGSWGGAMAQLQASVDAGATWDDVTGAITMANTIPGQFIGDFPASYLYRVLLTGASGSTSLSSTLRTLDRV